MKRDRLPVGVHPADPPFPPSDDPEKDLRKKPARVDNDGAVRSAVIPPDLQSVIDAWPSLAEATRKKILALAGAE